MCVRVSLVRVPLVCMACLISLYLLSLQHLAFKRRHAELRKYVAETPYVEKKDRLCSSLEDFLRARAVPGASWATAPSLELATPNDVVRFLCSRDSAGRTQVHGLSCANFGLGGVKDCGCPRHLAAGTVDSYIGMLRAGFNDLGRRGAANPCDSRVVKDWLSAYRKEQLRHHVPVKQARPVFSTHIRLLVKEIDFRLATLLDGEPFFPQRFTLLRDRAFFLAQWFSGDRAGDLGRALAREVVRLDNGSLLFRHTAGKTVRESSQLLVIPHISDEPAICPVLAFDTYVSACKAAGVDLLRGHLFPPTAAPRHTSIRDAPLTSDAATRRLRLYLPDENLSAHGSRAGCAVTLLMLGATRESVMEHCRWASAQVCLHYTRLERVRSLDTSASVLKAGVSTSDGVSEADSAAYLYELLNSGLLQTPAIL